MPCGIGGSNHSDQMNSQHQARTKRPSSLSSMMFSLPVDEGRPGETAVRRTNLYGKPGPLVATYSPEVATMFDSFQLACQKYPEHPYLGSRERLEDGKVGAYHWITYKQALMQAKAIGQNLRTTLQLSPQSCIGVYSINRKEWMLTDHGCIYASIITVPLYDTLGDEAIGHICNQTNLQVIACAAEKIPNLLKLKGSLSQLRCLIVFDWALVQPNVAAECTAAGVEIVAFETLLSLKEPVASIAPPTAKDIMTICYTSGTTGLPKGAIITHETCVAELGGIFECCNSGRFIDIQSGPIRHLSFLPLAHVFERVIQHFFAAAGASIGFYQGDTLKVLQDAAELKPTVLIAVPRVLNKIYDRVISGLDEVPSWKRWMFKTAYAWKKHFLRGGSTKSALFDTVVFAKLRALLGGEVRAIVTGAAPISGEVLELIRICFACDVYEGYGQTETCAASFVSWSRDCTTGHVGAPLPSVEVKLVDIGEMEYFATDKPYPRGEVCLRGPSCFPGYWQDAEKTAEAIDSEGWVHTGDVGLFDARGRLRIIDRKKNIFKLSQGEYVAPERVENILAKHPLLSQVFIWGESIKSCLVAVIVLEAEAVKRLVPNCTSAEEACKDPKAIEAVMAAITEFGSKGTKELKGFELPRRVHLESEPFSIQNGLLTDTMKMKRHEAKKRYLQVIEQLYSTLHE